MILANILFGIKKKIENEFITNLNFIKMIQLKSLILVLDQFFFIVQMHFAKQRVNLTKKIV